MILTTDEIEEAAKRLYQTSQHGIWSETEETTREAYRTVVNELAKAVDCQRTDDAVAFFISWMSDPHVMDLERRH